MKIANCSLKMELMLLKLKAALTILLASCQREIILKLINNYKKTRKFTYISQRSIQLKTQSPKIKTLVLHQTLSALPRPK